MVPSKKWRLSTGKIVEDELYQFAHECPEEQYVFCMHGMFLLAKTYSTSPCHSWIIDPRDENHLLSELFTSEELAEIVQYEAKQMPQLTQILSSYIDEFQLVIIRIHALLFDINMVHGLQPRISVPRSSSARNA